MGLSLAENLQGPSFAKAHIHKSQSINEGAVYMKLQKSYFSTAAARTLAQPSGPTSLAPSRGAAAKVEQGGVHINSERSTT